MKNWHRMAWGNSGALGSGENQQDSNFCKWICF